MNINIPDNFEDLEADYSLCVTKFGNVEIKKGEQVLCCTVDQPLRDNQFTQVTFMLDSASNNAELYINGHHYKFNVKVQSNPNRQYFGKTLTAEEIKKLFDKHRESR